MRNAPDRKGIAMAQGLPLGLGGRMFSRDGGDVGEDSSTGPQNLGAVPCCVGLPAAKGFVKLALGL